MNETVEDEPPNMQRTTAASREKLAPQPDKWAAYRSLWTSSPVIEILTKGLVLMYSLCAMVLLLKQSLVSIDRVSDDLKRGMNVGVVTILIVCTIEALTWGLAGEAMFLMYVEHPVRRLLIAKWTLLQIETALLVASLTSILAAYVYLEVFLEQGIAAQFHGLTEQSHTVYVTVWLVLLGRIMHSVVLLRTFRSKKAIIRLNLESNVVTREHLMAALDKVPDVPPSLYLHCKGLIEEIFEMTHQTRELSSANQDITADIANLCMSILHPDRITSMTSVMLEVNMAGMHVPERGITQMQEARQAVCLALLETAESLHEQSWVSKVNAIISEVPVGAYGIVQTFAATFKWLGRHFLLSVLIVLGTAVSAAAAVMRSIVIGMLAGNFADVTSDTPILEFVLPGIYMGIVVAVNRMSNVVAAAAAQKIRANLLDDISRRLFLTVCGGQTSLSDGDLIGRFARDSVAFAEVVRTAFPFQIIYPLVVLVSSMVALFQTSWQLAVVFLLCIPAGYPIVSNLPLRAHKAAAREQGKLQATFNNCVSLQRVMAIYDAGGFVLDNAASSLHSADQAMQKAAFLQTLADAFVEMWAASLLCFAFIVVLFKGFADISDGADLSAAASSTTTAILLIFEVSSPVGNLARGVSSFNSIAASLWRIDDAINKQATQIQANTDRDSCHDESNSLPLLTSAISYTNAEFRYPGSDKSVLKGINAELPAGSVTCIVGFSGAGKSTMLYLLTREHVETGGSVCFDSVPLSNVSVKEVRKQLGVVLQDSILLNGTIMDNIRLGAPDATRADVEQAATRAECHDFITGLPKGFDTLVGEDGETQLSGGQRQRICVARALCRHPRLLLLDEATSALDPTTERAIMDTITRLSRDEGLSVVSITHKMATTDKSDQVLVLKDGKIIESGTQTELLRQKGAFHALYRAGDGNNRVSIDKQSGEGMPEIELGNCLSRSMTLGQIRSHLSTLVSQHALSMKMSEVITPIFESETDFRSLSDKPHMK